MTSQTSFVVGTTVTISAQFWADSADTVPAAPPAGGSVSWTPGDTTLGTGFAPSPDTLSATVVAAAPGSYSVSATDGTFSASLTLTFELPAATSMTLSAT